MKRVTRSSLQNNTLEQLEASDPKIGAAAKKYEEGVRAILAGTTKKVEVDRRVLRWLFDVATHARVYRSATCAAIGGVKLNADTEGEYDRAATRLDGSLNELRIALVEGKT